MHAILTLHEKIRTGEITKRRPGVTGAGIDLASEPTPARLGRTAPGRARGDAAVMASVTTSAAELAGDGVLASERLACGQEVLHVGVTVPRGGRDARARPASRCAPTCAPSTT